MVQRDAGDDVLVDFEDVELFDIFLDRRLGPIEQLFPFHGLPREIIDGPDVPLGGLADLLIFVAVNEGADAFVRENFIQQTIKQATID